MSRTHELALKAATILWVVRGIVHILGGIVTMADDATGGFQGIAAAVEPDDLGAEYHPAVEAMLNQHGWNLPWVGVPSKLQRPPQDLQTPRSRNKETRP